MGMILHEENSMQKLVLLLLTLGLLITVLSVTILPVGLVYFSPTDNDELSIVKLRSNNSGIESDVAQSLEEPDPAKVYTAEGEDIRTKNKTFDKVSASEAEKLNKEMFSAFGDIEGPIVVGGIGDSGTRGTCDLLSKLGVFMGDAGSRNSARDSRIFMHHYPVHYMNTTQWAGPVAFYAKGIMSAHSLLYDRETLRRFLNRKRGDAKWYSGIQWVSQTVLAHFNYYKEHSTLYQKLNAANELSKFMWGFKHPRTLTLLPYFKGALKDNFRIVHVVRDGRDVALGDNRMMMDSLCRRYFPHDLVLEGYCMNRMTKNFTFSVMNNLRFWAVMNMDIIEWARLNLGPRRYLIVRTEDLVNGKVECIKRVQDFLYDEGDSRRISNTALKDIAKGFTPYNSSYNGNKLSSTIKEKITQAMEHVPEAMTAMKYFGYKLETSMGTAKECSMLNKLLL